MMLAPPLPAESAFARVGGAAGGGKPARNERFARSSAAIPGEAPVILE